MIYPKFLNEGDTVGVCAPSDGINSYINLTRFDNAILNFNKIGLNIIESESCRKSIIGKSADKKIRANEVCNMFKKADINGIICLSGGDFLIEILPYIDFDIIKENPKWLQGYSDPTALLFVITTMLDIATIYGYNFKTFGMEKWHDSLKDDILLLMGDKLSFNSYEKYEEKSLEYITGKEGFNLDTSVKINSINLDIINTFSGRIIGGCLDVLLSIIGTKFDFISEFISKYKNDGIIWFFDNCELTSEQIIRGLWQLKNAGAFKNCNGIIFGRSGIEKSCYNISFEDAIKEGLEDLKIPIILNANIGHKPPQIPIIIGSFAEIFVKNGSGRIKYSLI